MSVNLLSLHQMTKTLSICDSEPDLDIEEAHRNLHEVTVANDQTNIILAHNLCKLLSLNICH